MVIYRYTEDMYRCTEGYVQVYRGYENSDLLDPSLNYINNLIKATGADYIINNVFFYLKLAPVVIRLYP